MEIPVTSDALVFVDSPARVRAVARTASSPSELPPARELLEQIAGVMNLEARIER